MVLAPRVEGDDAYEAQLQAFGVSFLGHGFAVAVRALISRALDAVFCEFQLAADCLERIARSLQPDAMIIVDSVGVHYLREREMARLGRLDRAVAHAHERA